MQCALESRQSEWRIGVSGGGAEGCGDFAVFEQILCSKQTHKHTHLHTHWRKLHENVAWICEQFVYFMIIAFKNYAYYAYDTEQQQQHIRLQLININGATQYAAHLFDKRVQRHTGNTCRTCRTCCTLSLALPVFAPTGWRACSVRHRGTL